MKKLFKYVLLVAVTAVVCVFGVRWYYTGRITRTRTATDIIGEAYYKIHCSIFESMPKNNDSIIFLGDSITNYVKFDELVPGKGIINRGIAGDTTFGVLNRLDEVISRKPAKLFILIGTNDIVFGVSPDKIAENIKTIIHRVQEGTSATKIYLQTLMPTNPSFKTNRPNETINAVNVKIKSLAEENGCILVDTNKHMSENGELPLRYTVDGLHLSGEGVLRWCELLKTLI